MNTKQTNQLDTKEAALHAFALRWDPIEESLEIGEQADAGFDAGEWSGPAHAKLHEERYEECITAVAADLGLDPETLRAYLDEANHADEATPRMTDTTTFRYEGLTEGQRIRALDFAPREGRGACAIEGPITAVCRDGSPGHLFAHYVIKVERDIWRGEDVQPGQTRVGTLFCVPMETSLDFDGRVTLADQLNGGQGK